MSPISIFVLFVFLIKLWPPLPVGAKVYMVLMEDDSVDSYRHKPANQRSLKDAPVKKENLIRKHDMFLESVLQKATYSKLYSYTHLINGFAINVTSDEALKVLKDTEGVRKIHEDIKMTKLTTHTPDFLKIPDGVWPSLGGAQHAGEGVVIGIIDTGINPDHPSFTHQTRGNNSKNRMKFTGKCATGEGFSQAACNGKIVAAQYFARGAIAAGEFNATRDYASSYDADGHGSHAASIAAGNSGVAVISNGFDYGSASGMAPAAQLAIYKALYTFGGYMCDVVAAVDQAVQDGVDVLNLSLGVNPSSVPPGPSAFLNVLEIQLLFATRAGVLVVQAAGNDGPFASSILSFNPWITVVAASLTDRRYNNSIKLRNGEIFSGTGLAPATAGQDYFPMAAAVDVCHNSTVELLSNCQNPELFITTLVKGKLIICTYSFDFEDHTASISVVAKTMQVIGAAGFILTMDPDLGDVEQVQGVTITYMVPSIVLNTMHSSAALWKYYNSNTIRNRAGRAVGFAAHARILGGRRATYTGQAPIVASYSSRGPVTADVLQPNIMAPGSYIWAAWSPNSEGQNFALVSGTSMATPHIAGVAALIKQKHPNWSPAAITSAMMTSADTTDNSGAHILAQKQNALKNGTAFDYGAGFINPTRAINPGLIFDATFEDYLKFLCDVPGVDHESVRRELGSGCPTRKRKAWCSDLNTASVTVSNLVGSRNVTRVVKSITSETETYQVTVIKQLMGVSVTVSPTSFSITPNVSMTLHITLKAKEPVNAYSFGELLLTGNKNHLVRIPLAVNVTML